MSISQIDDGMPTESTCQTGGLFSKLYPTNGDQVTSRMDESMDCRLKFEQLTVGQTWTSPSRTITETDVVNFANTTGDHNPLHTDHEFAKRTHFRQPIAHGLLGLSWVAGLGSSSPSVDTVAFTTIRNWEFTRPLFFGDTVFVRTEVVRKQENVKRSGRVVWRMELINQRGDVTQHGEFETLVKAEGPVRAPHFDSNRSKTSSSNTTQPPTDQ